MHRPSIWAGAIAISILLFLIGARVWGDFLYDYPANPNPLLLPKDTVVVVLAGGKHRIEAAYSLFADGIGDRLWIIGAGKKATVMGLARAQASEVAQKIPWDRFDRITVETESKNTLENAFAVKRLIEQQNPQAKTLLLVTSSYHMRRAQLMIANQISADIKILPFVPPQGDFGHGNWWHTWSGMSLTIAEYVKYLFAAVIVPRLGYF